MGIRSINTRFVKPGSMKLAMGHLLHGEAAHWNHALQTPMPPWIQGRMHHSLMACCATHMYRVYQVECSCWPSLCHCSPPSLDPVCSTLVQIVITVCLQGTWLYTIFYDTCNAWYIVLGPWVDLVHCSLNQSECPPTPPFDWGKLVYSLANQNPGLMWRALSK